ncbi:Acg family FMN-binding oxidoreductase [Piscinibacter sp.]|uniref:Acg family FMN-binding oxidoreductase n=1 Tax=Piscinibacter sp. TaxID=1903157 RepID=UPI002CA65D19|nr:twin-arginine translocation pathway signal protein [Albitalea sp.]HUG22998.1 twin-arginine translocation pathway signal protein [Albitalea sp.]
MQRRQFIRLVGGGTVAAAFAGCSTDYPAAAVAAWQGPADGADLRRWALGYAILAPNSHNRQPWIADLREPSSITLFVDRERLLPQTDPWFRQIVVSQGTFVESLVIALRERGIDPRVQFFPDGEFEPHGIDDRPVARISWQPGQPPAPKDPLFAQLLRRHTAKVDYDMTRPVAPATLESLRGSQVDAGVRFGATVDPSRVETLRELCWQSAQVELLTPRTVMESVRLTRVGPDEIARHRDGITINGWFPRLANALGAFDRSAPPAEGSAAYKQMMSRFEGHSRSAMGFVWLSTPTAEHAAARTTRSAELRAGRAYMRLQLAATELGLQMHPMSQALQEFEEMKPHYERLHQLLEGRPAAESTVQMFCRVGHCEDQAHAPRRELDAIIRG